MIFKEWWKDHGIEQASYAEKSAAHKGFIAGAASRDAEVAALREQVKIARGYFEAIIDPIAYMRSKLENGQRLNGQMAIQLSENHSYLKGLAKKALATTEPKT